MGAGASAGPAKEEGTDGAAEGGEVKKEEPSDNRCNNNRRFN